MPKGNQSYFKTTNESVERFVLLTKWESGEERISGIYDRLKSLKCGMKNGDRMLNYCESYRIAKVKITIEELEKINLEEK
jgi:hypothetical protein